MKGPPKGLLAVLAALAVCASVTAAVGTPARRTAQAQSVEVVGATAVCPDLFQVPGVLETRVSVGVAPLPAGVRPGPRDMEQQLVSGKSPPRSVPVREPGQVAVGLATGITNDGLVISARGGLAPGLEVEQVTRGERGANRGLAGLRCGAPQQDTWFVGSGTGVHDAALLILANAEDSPSTVDITVFTSQGPADPRLGQGFTVLPHSRLVIPLDTLAPDRAVLAVHVLARRGRVAAALRHNRVLGSVPLGIDWVPQALPPATSVVVPGFPMGPGQRVLMVANPGLDDTQVSVQITAIDGQFVPTHFDAIPVPAGTVVPVFLDPLAAQSPLAVTVTSTGAPIVAGGFVLDVSTAQVQEFAYTTGSEPLTGPAVMTDLVINPPTESTLILSCPAGGARVVVTPIRVLGTSGPLPAPKTVVVPPGRTATLRLSTFFPPGATTRLAVEVRPLAGSGPVYAARYLRENGAHGPLSTLLDLQGPAQQVSRPPVVQDPRAPY